MKFNSIIILITSLALAACQSDITNKPAAAVSQTAATTESGPAAGGVPAEVIREKSAIRFVGAKVTGDHQGEFKNFDGFIEYVDGRPHRVAFTIDLNSMETDAEKLTGHLKSADFFDVARYPQARFTSKSLTAPPAGSPAGTTHLLKGTLDLHGVKKDITIPVKTEQTANGVRTTSEFTLNRHDWGISYKGAADDLIRDNVLIRLDLAFPPPPQA